MTNNKSECEHGKYFNGNGVPEDCPICHLGDSLRKQEEKQYIGNTNSAVNSEPIICPMQGRMSQCSSSEVCHHTPKVATSEEECEELEVYGCEDCPHKIMEDKPTPHESEDREVSLEYLVKDFFQSIQGSTTDWQERRLMEFIESEKSKAYQRGKVEQFEKLHERIPKLEEEAYQRGREYTMNDLLKQAEKAKEMGRQEVIDFAVQEIEKGKQPSCLDKCKCNVEFNKGLDKAKSIISGVMKK